MYKVEYAPLAIKQLKKLDKHISALIIGWIEKNLVDCEEPKQYGKGLVANRSGEWRYRIGDYRILADIQDDKLVILIITVGIGEKFMIVNKRHPKKDAFYRAT